MKNWILGALALSIGLAACSNRVEIKPETTGSGASHPGTGGSTSTGSTGSTGPAPPKVVTADTDMAQYASITTTTTALDPVDTLIVEGPFFITDAIAVTSVLTTVQGNDCSIPVEKHTIVLTGNVNTGVTQFHGLRLPVLSGQSLCVKSAINYNVTVLGFKPY